MGNVLTGKEISEEEAARGVEDARRLAAAALPDLIGEIYLAATSEGASPAQKFNAADFFYKVSGASAKNQPVPVGNGFQLNIILNGGKDRVELTAAPTAERVVEEVPAVEEFVLPERKSETRFPVEVDNADLSFDD